MVFIRSILYTVCLFVSFFLMAPIALLPYPFMTHQRRWVIAIAWGELNIFLVKKICGLSYTIRGLENAPDERCVVFAKHSSVYEIFVLLKYFSPSSWVGKHELMYVPIFRGVFKKFKLIPVKRGKGHTEVERVRNMGKERLAGGNWIIVFPEGTRMKYNKTGRYGLSGALLAKETRSVVLPISHNSGKYWKRRGLLKHPGKIEFFIGRPINTENLSIDEINDVSKEWIQSRVAS